MLAAKGLSGPALAGRARAWQSAEAVPRRSGPDRPQRSPQRLLWPPPARGCCRRLRCAAQTPAGMSCDRGQLPLDRRHPVAKSLWVAIAGRGLRRSARTGVFRPRAAATAGLRYRQLPRPTALRLRTSVCSPSVPPSTAFAMKHTLQLFPYQTEVFSNSLRSSCNSRTAGTPACSGCCAIGPRSWGTTYTDAGGRQRAGCWPALPAAQAWWET